MTIELESADEIKAALEKGNNPPQEEMDNQPKDEVEDKVIETKEEEKQEIKPRLPLSERLDLAYQQLDSTEREAWKQGWRPQEFFNGKSRNGKNIEWIDAQTFLDRAKNNLPVANDRIRELTKQIEEIKKEAKEAKTRVIEAEKRGYQKALEELGSKQREAVESGDIDQFDKLKQQELDILKKYQSEPSDSKGLEKADNVVEDVMQQNNPQNQYQQPNTPELSEEDKRVLMDWQARNMWMSTDPKLAAYAIQSEKEIMQKRPYLSLEDRLNIVEEEVKETFHQKFNSERPQNISNFDSSGENSNSSNISTKRGKGYNDLPADAKKICDSLIRMRKIESKGSDAVKEFRQKYAQAHFNQ